MTVLRAAAAVHLSFPARTIAAAIALAALHAATAFPAAAQSPDFDIEEAGIADIQRALLAGEISTLGVVEAYLRRIQAYDDVCVSQPEGELGPITPIPNAGQLNALGALNLRPAARAAWGFGPRSARSQTDPADDDPDLPDALETAAAQDRELARTGRLAGPLHGVVVTIKDQYDTRDLRTTNGADVPYADDRPPQDATVVARLREAGAIVLAKANRGGSQPRSAFGGVVCNPYDTERTPRASSSGSAVSVSANLATCSIGEETGISIRGPASATNIVGLSPTQELVSRAGATGPGIQVRAGPLCRTVEDTAHVLDAIAGFDPRDSLTAFSVGRAPAQPYAAHARSGGESRRLDGVRIGVVREFMDRSLFTLADHETIRIVERAVDELRGIGAEIVDPGEGGALLQQCFREQGPEAFGILFTRQHPDLFPVDEDGRPVGDHVRLLAELAGHPERVPDDISIRNIPAADATGDSLYWRWRYVQDRGDANIRTPQELAALARPIEDPQFQSVIVTPGGGPAPPADTVDLSERILQRFAFQQVVLHCMAQQGLDALVHPSINIPPLRIQAPEEPPVNGRIVYHWTVFGVHGFPMISVPAGFTTEIHERVTDDSAPEGSRLIGPVPARLPVGVDFTARPFDEAALLEIAAAYEQATRHRSPPPDFTGLPHAR